MKLVKFLPVAVAMFGLFMIFATPEAAAQPSAAQLKALEPKTAVSFTWHQPGKREWSSTYKKYVYSIYWTAKRKTDQPGVLLLLRATHHST